MRTKSGFTIVELLIVIVVIGIIVSIGVVSYNGVQARAYDSRRVNDIAIIMKALSLYKIENGNFPASQPNPGSSTWEISTDPGFLSSLGSVVNGTTFRDPANASTKSYWYRTFVAGDRACPPSLGPYYVIWARGMQAQSSPRIDTRGCDSQNLFATTPTPGAFTIGAADYIIYGFN